jgi:hypothetical protein
MNKWLRWAFFFKDGKYSYGKWNQPDDGRARICQAMPNIDRVEIHAKMMAEDQRTEVLAVMDGVKYKKIMFDMQQVFSPMYGMTVPKLQGMRLVSNQGEELKVIGG